MLEILPSICPDHATIQPADPTPRCRISQQIFRPAGRPGRGESPTVPTPRGVDPSDCERKRCCRQTCSRGILTLPDLDRQHERVTVLLRALRRLLDRESLARATDSAFRRAD